MLTPQDIELTEFKKSLYGYSPKEVEEFLRNIREDYEKLYKENLAASDRIAVLSDAVKQYKAMEENVQNTLDSARESADEIKKNAADRAAVILKEAENKAAEILNRATEEASQVTYNCEQMKRGIEVFRARVVALLNAQLDIIKVYPDIEADDNSKAQKSLDMQDTEELPGIAD